MPGKNKKYRLPLLLVGVGLILSGWYFFPVLALKYQLCRLERINWNKQKIWVHRVNSAQRLRYLIPNFSGFEMDLVYQERLERRTIHTSQSG